MDSPFVPQFGVLPGVNLPVPHSQPPLLHQAGRPDTSTDSSINGHLNFSMPSASAHLPPPPQASAPSIISPTPASQPNPPSHAQQAISPWTPMPFGNPPMPMSSTNTEDPSLTHHSPASSSSTLQNGLGRKRMRMSTGNSSIMTYPAPRQQQPPLPSVPPLVQNASFRNTSQHAEASTSRKRPAPQQWPDSTIPSASRSSTGGSGVKSEDSPPAGGTIVQPFEAVCCDDGF